MTKHFKPEFKQEVAELFIDKGYSNIEAAETISVGKTTVDAGYGNYAALKCGCSGYSVTLLKKQVCWLFPRCATY